MKRRINSTGRKNIPLDKLTIRLQDIGTSTARSFTANLTKLTELGLDSAARVYVEPYVKSSSMRLSFGTVGSLSTPTDTRLTEIDSGGAVLFRVIVVDESAEVGKILAAASHIRPMDETDNEDDEKAILPVRLRDLGEAVWAVDIDSQARPELVLNNRIPLLSERLKSDPLIQGIIIPRAMSIVLKAAMSDEVDDAIEWVQDWKKFAAALLGEELEDGLDPEELEGRLLTAVQKFVTRMKFATRAAAVPIPTGVFHD